MRLLAPSVAWFKQSLTALKLCHYFFTSQNHLLPLCPQPLAISHLCTRNAPRLGILRGREKKGEEHFYSQTVISIGVVNCVGLNSCSCFLLSGQMLRGFARVCVCVRVFWFPSHLPERRPPLLPADPPFPFRSLAHLPPSHTLAQTRVDRLAEPCETCACASACGCLRASATKVEQMH